MSKHFELISQLELTDELFPESTAAAAEHSERGRAIPRKSLRPTVDTEASNLVQRLFFSKTAAAPRVVVFTGVESGVGCSWVCARAAQALALKVPGQLCVVDGNLRSPALHQYFEMSNRRGLLQSLEEPFPIREYLQASPDDKLMVLPAGCGPTDAPTWRADRIARRIIELRETFAFVLIDSSAAGPYADVAVLGSAVEGAVLVIDAEHTRRDAALHARDFLVAASVPILGAALNRRRFPIPECIYRRL
jgi:Mrp family chromosome partitioning ATPase